jgi:dTDP-4-dehydrorhamnose 3,5-epimerase
VKILDTPVADVYRLVPTLQSDSRGHFFEAYRHDLLEEVLGRSFVPRQCNYSSSRLGTLRGVHGVSLPLGQAKLVSCVRGRILDVVVDIRVGSPSYGKFTAFELSASEGASVFIAEGLGHAFMALTDDVCVSYLCSTEHVPGTQVHVDATDVELRIPWPTVDRLYRSPRDVAAPSLAEAQAAGLLASYAECRALYARTAAKGGVDEI